MMGAYRPASKAFTLIEVMVVIFVIAICASFLVPRMELSNDQYLRYEAVRFRNVLQWATEQALYEDRDLSLVVNFEESSYQLVTVVDEKTVVLDDKLIKRRALKKNAGFLSWGLDQGLSNQDSKLIVLTAWGPMEPIMLRFNDHGGESGYQVIYSLMQFRPLLQPWSV